MEKNDRKEQNCKGMDKPKNPYRKGSLIWSVMEGDWEDLTVTQIAEVLGAMPNSISSNIAAIKRETGYDVPRASGRVRRRPNE